MPWLQAPARGYPSAAREPDSAPPLPPGYLFAHSQLPSSVASGSAVGAGYNGLIWNEGDGKWEEAHTLTAPAGMTAQDLLIGDSSTAVSRIAVGAKGEQTVVRHDGTIGYITVLPNAQAWGANPNAVTEGEITSNTEALQSFVTFSWNTAVTENCHAAPTS
jgi:hypothetical protein